VAREFAGGDATGYWRMITKDTTARRKVVVVTRNSCLAFPPTHVEAVSDLEDLGVLDA
jgi:hypothetical protein